MSSAPAVALSALTKSFTVIRPRSRTYGSRLLDFVRPRHARVVAVNGISFSIAPGERVAFIGPNGAGKSTSLKMLSGILHPDSGEATVLGRVPWRDRRALAFEIGTVFGQRSQLWYQLPPRDTFSLLSHVYEVDPAVHRQRLSALVEAFELGACLDTPVRQLSLGQRMRAEILASLLHTPRVLFLDEPTIGLDVTAKAAIRDRLRSHSETTGATLLLTSHDTGDIEGVCHRAIVIHQGQVMWDGPIADLRRRHMKARRITLWSEAPHLVLDLPGVRVLSHRPYFTEIELTVGATPVGAVVDAAVRQGALHDMTIEDTPLDDVIRELYGSAARGSAS
jgi:ABC-2 type transport system ATP-binding protein